MNNAAASASVPNEGAFALIPHNEIKPWEDQPRSYIDDKKVAEYAASIAAEGQKVPISVTQIPGNQHYTIISGEHRWRACQNIATTNRTPFQMKTVIEPFTSTAEMFDHAFIDNVARSDMSPLDTTAGYLRWQARGISIKDMATKAGCTVQTIAKYLSLDGLCDEVKDLMNPSRDCPLKIEHAVKIAMVPYPAMQFQLASEALAAGWTVADVAHHSKPFVPDTPSRPNAGGGHVANLQTPASSPPAPQIQREMIVTFVERTRAFTNRHGNIDPEDLKKGLKDPDKFLAAIIQSLDGAEKALRTMRETLEGGSR